MEAQFFVEMLSVRDFLKQATTQCMSEPLFYGTKNESDCFREPFPIDHFGFKCSGPFW